jgi:hypothetical protein
VGDGFGALYGRELVEQLADGVPQAVPGTFGGLAQEALELREVLLDRVEVGE